MFLWSYEAMWSRHHCPYYRVKELASLNKQLPLPADSDTLVD
jgi:hypothetical protein